MEQTKRFHIVRAFDVVPSIALAVEKNSNVTAKIDRIINLILAGIGDFILSYSYY